MAADWSDGSPESRDNRSQCVLLCEGSRHAPHPNCGTWWGSLCPLIASQSHMEMEFCSHHCQCPRLDGQGTEPRSQHTQGSQWDHSPLSMISNLRYIIFSVYCFAGTNTQIELLLKLEGLFILSELALSHHCRGMAMVSRSIDPSPTSKGQHPYIGLPTHKSCWSC